VHTHEPVVEVVCHAVIITREVCIVFCPTIAFVERDEIKENGRMNKTKRKGSSGGQQQ
jgi:hypothetical protein